MRVATPLRAVLQVIGEFDEYGGASVGLIAWELCVDESLVGDGWKRARAAGLIAPAGYDQYEQLWRLTRGVGGALRRAGERLSRHACS